MLEGQADGLNLVIAALGEICNGAMPDFAIISKGLPEQMRGIGLSVDGLLDGVESHNIARSLEWRVGLLVRVHILCNII